MLILDRWREFERTQPEKGQCGGWEDACDALAVAVVHAVDWESQWESQTDTPTVPRLYHLPLCAKCLEQCLAETEPKNLCPHNGDADACRESGAGARWFELWRAANILRGGRMNKKRSARLSPPRFRDPRTRAEWLHAAVMLLRRGLWLRELDLVALAAPDYIGCADVTADSALQLEPGRVYPVSYHIRRWPGPAEALRFVLASVLIEVYPYDPGKKYEALPAPILPAKRLSKEARQALKEARHELELYRAAAVLGGLK